jgi:adenosine deaminase
LKDHPIRPFFEKGLFVTVNSDDPTIFGIELIDEYVKLYDHNMFTPKEIVQLLRNSVFATFLPASKKEKLWSEAESAIEKSSLPLT